MSRPQADRPDLWEDWSGSWGTLKVHAAGTCQGDWCVVHKPMPGPWTDWPLHWRGDRNIMERICPCGVGHPAAEQLGWWASSGREFMSIHGCCGRCKCGPGGVTRETGGDRNG